MNDARNDWIAHRRPHDGGDENPLFIDIVGSEAGVEVRLERQHTRPRALPAFVLAPDQAGSCTLRCTGERMALATTGHFLCAVPDGTVEIDRTSVSEWERFLLVDRDDYDWLTQVLRRGRIAAAGDQPLPVTLGEGLTLVSGDHRISLATNLSSRTGNRLRQLTTTTGSEVSVILE